MSDEPIATGLLGVPTLPPPVAQPIGLPVVAAPAPLPAANMPAGWTIQKTAAFIRELAHNMYDVPFILKTHGVTQAQYDGIKDQEFFQGALRAMTVEWNSIGNTQKRLAIEAAIALEDALPAMAAHLSKTRELTPAIIEFAKLLAKMAGVGEVSQNNAPTERFKITINLGADVQTFDKGRPVQLVTEGPGQEPAVLALTN